MEKYIKKLVKKIKKTGYDSATAKVAELLKQDENPYKIIEELLDDRVRLIKRLEKSLGKLHVH